MFNALLVHPLFNLLVVIYAFVHDFGVSLIIMTILSRLVLWPLVNKQLHSQRALQKLAPEAAKVKAKAKGDKQLESKLLMELYKEREINPFSSLLPLFVQLPILIALFVVIRSIVKPGEIAALSYASVRALPYIKDVIAGHPAFNTTFLGLVDLAKPSIFLGALAGITQFLQAKQLMPAKSDDPNAKAMAATSYLFPFLTVFIALRLPSALALFWTVTSLVALVQQARVLRHDAKDLGAGNAK